MFTSAGCVPRWTIPIHKSSFIPFEVRVMSSTSAPNPLSRRTGSLALPRSWSLAARLTAWYTASAFVLILLATGFLYWVLYSNLEREDDQYLADKVRILSG